jgi:K+-transporting ATPase KdpF subunit
MLSLHQALKPRHCFYGIQSYNRSVVGKPSLEEAFCMADLWLAGAVASLLLVYLAYVLMNPEEF